MQRNPRSPYVPTDPRSIGDLTFFTDFENATATSQFAVDHDRAPSSAHDGIYTLSPGSWLHVGIQGTAGRRPRFRLRRPDHLDERRRYVWSPDGSEWHYFAHAEVSDDGDWYDFWPEDPFETDEIFLAGLFPYRLSDLEPFLRELRERPMVSTVGPRGFSPGRRPIYGLQITDPSVPEADKHNVVCLAGQHAWESWGRHVCHGMLERAVSADPAARRLRERAIIYAYPMANPDGVTLGHMKNGTVDHNPNRAWVLGSPPEAPDSPVPEVDVLRRTILEETDGEATYLIDFHSHAGWYDRFMWYADGSDPAVTDLIESIHRADAAGNDDAVVGTEAVGGASNSDRATSKRWARTLGATGLTFEATPYGSPTIERYRDAGGAFVTGLADVLD